MLVGEALGPGTQRLSGLPYIEPDGALRNTGRSLDAFLARFGYTIQPDGPGRYAYSTDLVRCFPRKPDGERPRPPTEVEAVNCSRWLEQEIALLRPKVLILLGRPAVSYVFKRYLGRRVRRLGDVAGGPYVARVGGVEVKVFAVPHPSPLAARPERNKIYAEVGRRVAESLTGE